MEVKCPYCNHNLNFLLSKDKMLMNARGNASQRASRIRSLTVLEEKDIYTVIAWISDNETMKMGIFETANEALDFLRLLNKQIEEIHG